MPDDPQRKTMSDTVDRNLRSAYARVLDEEMPEQFEVLLERLRQKRLSKPTSGSED